MIDVRGLVEHLQGQSPRHRTQAMRRLGLSLRRDISGWMDIVPVLDAASYRTALAAMSLADHPSDSLNICSVSVLRSHQDVAKYPPGQQSAMHDRAYPRFEPPRGMICPLAQEIGLYRPDHHRASYPMYSKYFLELLGVTPNRAFATLKQSHRTFDQIGASVEHVSRDFHQERPYTENNRALSEKQALKIA